MPLGDMTHIVTNIPNLSVKKKQTKKNKKQSCFKSNAFNNLAYSDKCEKKQM